MESKTMFDPEKLLEFESGEIFFKVAELLEMNTTATAILHKIDRNGSQLVLASNVSNGETKRLWEELFRIIDSQILTEDDWNSFFRICMAYIHSNLHVTLSTKLVKIAYLHLINITKEARTPGFVGFYKQLTKIVHNGPEVLPEIYVKNIRRKIQPHHMNLILFALQKQILNLLTIRYFIHDPDQLKYKDKRFQIVYDMLQLLGSMQVLESPSEEYRHAEITLLDHCIENQLFMSCSSLYFYTSKLLCMNCHATLETFRKGGFPAIELGLAHDLKFEKWSPPKFLPTAFQLIPADAYDKTYQDLLREYSSSKIKCRILYFVPLIIIKALESDE